MDKIWYRNPSKSEVIGRCGGDEKTRMTPNNAKKKKSTVKLYYQLGWKNTNTTDVRFHAYSLISHFRNKLSVTADYHHHQ